MKLSELKALAGLSGIKETWASVNAVIGSGGAQELLGEVEQECERRAVQPRPGPRLTDKGDDITENRLRGRTRLIINGVPFVDESYVEQRERKAYERAARDGGNGLRLVEDEPHTGERKMAEAQAAHTPVEDHVAQARERGERMHQAMKATGAFWTTPLAFDDAASHPAALRFMAKRLDAQEQLLQRHEESLREHVDATKRATDSLANAMTDAENRAIAKLKASVGAGRELIDSKLEDLNQRLGSVQTKLEENTMSRAIGLKLIDRIAVLENEKRAPHDTGTRLRQLEDWRAEAMSLAGSES
jgi:hypothetical protein